MKVLPMLNAMKRILKEIEVSAVELPSEIQPDFKDMLQVIRDDINKAGDVVEKYYKDEKSFEKMQKDLKEQMSEISIYEGLDAHIKDTIIDRVIRSNDLNLLTSEQLSDFIGDRLKTSGVEDLIKKSYSKYDIIKLGESVESREASESKKYEAGIGILRGVVSTPRGREEAIAHGVEKIMKDTISRRYYISLYYGLTKSSKG